MYDTASALIPSAATMNPPGSDPELDPPPVEGEEGVDSSVESNVVSALKNS